MNRQTMFWIVGTVLCVGLVMLIARHFAAVVPRSIPLKESETNQAKRELVGVSSCSASACHGGVETGARLSEAATWRALDPHARAYTTLLSEQSRTIAAQLWSGKTQAHEAPLCLKCHVHPTYEQSRPNFRRQDGVGCESCHGSAGEWLAPHYRPNWKPSLGMLDTKTLAGRANVCATCHVGTPDANVDHDLIAAGHPALRFEFATYFANLPPHWDVAKDQRANSYEPDEYFDYEVRAWAIGQMVSSAAAFELTAHRADPANGKAWPEFAEFDCFACHHDLKGKSWRQDREYLANRKPGAMPMSDWYHRLLSFADSLDENGVISARPRDDFRVHLKNRKNLASAAREQASALRRNAAQLKEGLGAQVQLKLLCVFRSGETPKQLREQPWEGNAQDYLALLALRRAEDKVARDWIDALLTRMHPEVQFAPGYSSPTRSK